MEISNLNDTENDNDQETTTQFSFGQQLRQYPLQLWLRGPLGATKGLNFIFNVSAKTSRLLTTTGPLHHQAWWGKHGGVFPQHQPQQH